MGFELFERHRIVGLIPVAAARALVARHVLATAGAPDRPGDVPPLLVVPRDIWSLRMNSHFEVQESLLTQLSLSLSENNFLGLRKQLALVFSMDQGAYRLGPQFVDKNIAGTRLQLVTRAGVIFSRATDELEGSHSATSLSYPLWSLRREWGAAITVSHFDSVVRSFRGAGLRTYDVPATPEVEAIPWVYDHRTFDLEAGVTRAFGVRVKHLVTTGYQMTVRRPSVTEDFPGDATAQQAFEQDVLPRSERTSALFLRGSFAINDYVTYRNVNSFDLPEERVLTARVFVDLPAGGEREGTTASAADSVRTVTAALRSTLERLPEVTEVGVASHLPRVSPWPEPLEIEDRREVVEAPLVHQGPGVFETLEVRPVAGRLIEASDLEAGAPPVAVVNEAFAREQWGTAQAVGRRLRPLPHAGEGDPGPWRTVVGVVPNVMEVAAPAGSAGVYLPAPPGRFFYVAARLESNPMAFAGRLRRTIFDLDPGLVVSEVVRLDAVGAENRATLATLGSALSGVGLVTLLLALAGVYAVVSLAVSQRTREIGVRVALGAHRNSILWSILRRSGRLVVGGAALGAAAGAFASRFRVFAFVVPDQGLWLFPSLVLLMALAGAAACWLPARRALSVQPVEALRHDG